MGSATRFAGHKGTIRVVGSSRSAAFLVEAVVLCIADGAVGVGVGAMLSSVIRQSTGWNSAMTLSSLVLAFGFAAGVGIIFGVWPARRAAVLDPITALRYE